MSTHDPADTTTDAAQASGPDSATLDAEAVAEIFAAAEPIAEQGSGCAHCDAGEDHDHSDEKGLVDAYRGQLRGTNLVRVGLAVGATALGLSLAAPALGLGLVSWGVATVVGIIVLAVSRARTAMPHAILFGSIASAAVTPLLAWALTGVVGGTVTVAAAAALGWFLGVAGAESVRDHNLAAVLIADSRDGEAARRGVLFGTPIPPATGLAWSLLASALFGVWVWAIALMPLLVLPLIPLQVVLTLLTRKKGK